MVTRQRIKFLEEHRNRATAPASAAEEFMNPQWLAAVDTWIPTWQRWEEAENRRIAKRDEIKKRRVSQPWRRDSKTDDSWRLPGSTANGPDVGAIMGILPNEVPTSPTPAPIPANFLESPPTPVSASTALKLPPGFETMFSNPVQVPLESPPAPSDGRMVSAVLETLGKLNKHLDGATGESVASPVLSALVQAAVEAPNRDSGHSQVQEVNAHAQPTHVDIERMKEELRVEMQGQFRRELERSWVAMEEKLDSVQQTQEMILEMLRQEPGR